MQDYTVSGCPVFVQFRVSASGTGKCLRRIKVSDSKNDFSFLNSFSSVENFKSRPMFYVFYVRNDRKTDEFSFFRNISREETVLSVLCCFIFTIFKQCAYLPQCSRPLSIRKSPSAVSLSPIALFRRNVKKSQT